MNKTFAALSLAGNRLPFYNGFTLSSGHTTQFFNFKIRNSFSTFININSIKETLKVSGSSFNRFLRSPIKVDSSADMTSIMVTQHTIIDADKSDVFIIDTSFSHCSDVNDHGGAILFDRKTLSVTMDRVFFTKCTTSHSGGAFYAALDGATILRTCFEECEALESGHAFFINLNSKEFVSNFSEVSIIHSCPSTSRTGKAAALFLTGNYKIQLTNASNNHAGGFASAYGALGSNSLTIMFNEFQNSSSTNTIRLLDLQKSLTVAMSNFIGNKAGTSLIETSADNSFVNVVFLQNKVPHLISGEPSKLLVADCVSDTEYTLENAETPGFTVKKDAEEHIINFVFAGHCRVVAEQEGLDSQIKIKSVIKEISENQKSYFNKLAANLTFSPPMVTPRYVVHTEEPEIENPDIIPPHHGRNVPTRTRRIINPHPYESDPYISHHPRNNSHPPVGVITPISVPPRNLPQDTRTRANPPRVIAPTASFSPSETFYKSRTFLPSLQFTASQSPAQSLVPYVLYSAAGFVVFAVLTSFLFLKSSDAGYNLMTPSESADSRISDYASSTSTTITMTAESSTSVVV